MKRILAIFLLIALLLCGCVREGPDVVTEPTPQITEPTQPPVQEPEGPDFGIYKENSDIELTTDGAVRQFLPGGGDYYALRNMGDGLLLFSGTETTKLMLLREGEVPVTVELSCLLDPDSSRVSVTNTAVYYYDAADHTLVHLNEALEEASRMALPEDMDCLPVLSEDAQWLYYYAEDALRSFEVATGISRLLRQSKGEKRQTVDLQFDGQMLECQVDGKTEYIATTTGELLGTVVEETQLHTGGDRYFARMWQIDRWLELFGSREGNTLCMKPQWEGVEHILMRRNAVVMSRNTETGSELAYYELDGGTMPYGLALDDLRDPAGVTADAGGVYIWFFATQISTGKQALYCWDPTFSETGDTTVWLEPYHTAENPDEAGLAECAQLAKDLGNKYGVRIRIWQDALKTVPENYVLEAEYLPVAYRRDLAVLEKVLASYPAGMLKKMGKKSDNGKLTISLVRSAVASNELGVKAQEEGVYFRSGGNAYVILSMGEGLEQAAYHELFYAIDGYVMTQCNAYDFWNDLNPSGFDYDYSYIANADRDGEAYLKEDSRAFIDTYSMSFPMEDRARIMEYAMMEGNEAYFQSKTMQAKLKLLCQGIRTAFGMKKYEEPLIWERYLK